MPESHALRYAMLAVVLVALLLLLGGAGVAGAAQAGALPPIDWQLPLGEHRALLVHNGPTTACQRWALRDSCRPRVVRHEFYVHYISPNSDRQLLWFSTQQGGQP